MTPTRPTQPERPAAHPAPPRTMTALVQHGYGPPGRVLALEEVPVPAVGEGEVLVRVRATGVNTPDRLTVAGEPRILRLRSGLRGPRTAVRGSDVAGTVAAVGPGVPDLRPGDEVFGSLWTKSVAAGTGAFAEFAVAPAAQLVGVPAGLPVTEAGASVMSGLTALLAMRDAGGVGPGTRVLVNGASGGVGTFAVQIAKDLGAHVTGVCGPGNAELVRSLGADEVIDRTTEDYTRGPRRFDVVLDNVLNHPPAATIAVLRPGGVFIPNSIGGTNGLLGGLPRVARAALARPRDAVVRSVECDATREHLAALGALLASGRVKTIIERTYPLADAADAVAHMMTGRARGNLAITVGTAGAAAP